MDFVSINKTKNEEKQIGINVNENQGVQENANRIINEPDEHINVQRANDLNLDTFAVVTEDMCIDYTKRNRVVESVDSSLQSTKNLLTRLKKQRLSAMFNNSVDALYEEFTSRLSAAKEKNNNALDFASSNELIEAAKSTNESLAALIDNAISDLKTGQNIAAAPVAALVELQELRNKLARRIEINYEQIDSVPLEQILEIKTDKEEKKVRDNLLALGSVLESQMATLLNQSTKESSELFRNCCNSVLEFHTLLRSGKLDVAKQHEFMPVLTKMRTAVAAYYNENSGAKFSSKGRERKKMTKDILKSIDAFILESPEYIQLSFADEMESSDANIDAIEYSSTKELYKKLAEKKYKKDHPNENPEKVATADSYRVYAAVNANAEISDNVRQAIDDENLPLAIKTELDRQYGVLFGEIRKNHDGSYANEQMQAKANELRQLSEQLKAGNTAGMDAIYSAHVKKFINTYNSIDKLNYEYVTKHFRQIFSYQAGIDFENMFYKMGTMGGRWFMNQPRELQDRLRSVTYAGVLDTAFNGVMKSQNIDFYHNRYASATGVPPMLKPSYELASFIMQNGATFVYNNIRHVPEDAGEEEDLPESTYFDGETTYVVTGRNAIESYLMSDLGKIIDPEQMDELKENENDTEEVKIHKKEELKKKAKEYQRYKKASEEMTDTPVFGDNVLDYLHRKHKNPLITEQSIAIMKKLYKYSDPVDHYKYSKDPEIAALYDAADEQTKKAKGAGDDFDRQVGSVLKPVEYDLSGAPISEIDKKNEEWNLNYMRAYVTGNIADRIPYFDELIAEFEYYGEHPEIFDENHVLEHIEEYRRATRLSLVLIDNIFKDPINKQYFDSFSEEKKNYLHAVHSYIVNKGQIGLIKLQELGITANFTYATMLNGYNAGEAAAMELLKNMAKEEGEKGEREHGSKAGENSLASLKQKAINAEKERKLRLEAENNEK